MASVRLERLSKTYRCGVTALQDQTVTIPNGEFVCILGPSGSGKSTALELMAGIEEASARRIFYRANRFVALFKNADLLLAVPASKPPAAGTATLGVRPDAIVVRAAHPGERLPGRLRALARSGSTRPLRDRRAPTPHSRPMRPSPARASRSRPGTARCRGCSAISRATARLLHDQGPPGGRPRSIRREQGARPGGSKGVGERVSA